MTPHKESTKSTLTRDASGKQRSLTVLKGKNTLKNVKDQNLLIGDSCLFLNEKV